MACEERKRPLDRWAMVYKNRREMGERWCTKTTVGYVGDGIRKPP